MRIQVRFVTPAFLGNAEQSGQWRTPPFKALLRQWWRVVKAGQLIRDGTSDSRLHEALLTEEQTLFGYVGSEGNTDSKARRSRILVRLNDWHPGTLETWDQGQVGSYTYLGYGPLSSNQRDHPSGLSHQPAIDAGDTSSLALSYPTVAEEELRKTLSLINWFGTIGSRSRNGWGSLQLEGERLQRFVSNDELLTQNTRPITECIKLDWPHQFCTDEKGLLIWMTKSFRDWAAVLRHLTEVKRGKMRGSEFITKGFRTSLPLSREAGDIGERHILGYPVTDPPAGPKHRYRIDGWREDSRLPSQIRFKVMKTDDGYRALIYHLAFRLPNTLLTADTTPEDARRKQAWFNPAEQLVIWKKVHRFLDRAEGLHRIGD